MPLHRLLDLAILICKSKQFFRERYKKTTEEHLKSERLDQVALQGSAMNISLCKENSHLVDDLEIFDKQFRIDDEFVSERLARLSQALKELDY